jgi:hypothetical protein
VLAQHSYRQPGDDGHCGPQEETIHDRLDDDKVRPLGRAAPG